MACNDLVGVTFVMRTLGLSRSTVQKRYERLGLTPHWTKGGQRRFSRDEVRRVAARRAASQAEEVAQRFRALGAIE
jgi:DNA-binding transcriptional MerR regulator